MFSFALESWDDTAALESFWGEAMEADLPAVQGNTAVATTGGGDEGELSKGKIKISDRMKAGFKSMLAKFNKLRAYIQKKIMGLIHILAAKTTLIKVSRPKLQAYTKMQASGMTFFKALNSLVGQLGSVIVSGGSNSISANLSKANELYDTWATDANAFDNAESAVNDKNAHPTQYRFEREMTLSKAMDTTLQTNIKALEKVAAADSASSPIVNGLTTCFKRGASSISRMISATAWMLSQGSKNAKLEDKQSTALATT